MDEPTPCPGCGALLRPLDTERGRLWYEVVYRYRDEQGELAETDAVQHLHTWVRCRFAQIAAEVYTDSQ